MSANPHFTDVEQRLRTLRSGDNVDEGDIRALLESSDLADVRAGLKAIALTVRDDYDCFEESIPSLRPYLTDDDTDVRHTALQVAIDLLPARSDPATDAGAIADRLNDESDRVTEEALTAVIALADRAPDAAASRASDVTPFLRHDRSEIRSEALEFFETIVVTHPEAVANVVALLIERLGDTYDSPEFDADHWTTPLSDERLRDDVLTHTNQESERHLTIRETATRILVRIAGSRPDSVDGHVEALRRHLDSTDPHVRQSALTVLTVLGGERPAALAPVVENICTCLDAESKDALTAAAVQALGVAASEVPERVADGVHPRVQVVVEHFNHDSPHVRGAAVGLLSYVEEGTSDSTGVAVDDVVALLDDDHAFVRGNAVWALESFPTDAAVPPLEDRISTETDPDVQAAVETVLNRLSRSDGSATER